MAVAHSPEWKLKIRRFLKNCAGVLLLNPVYRLCCLRPIQKNLVVLADGHQNAMPFSMLCLAERLKQEKDITVTEYFHDYSFSGMARGLVLMLKFLPLYARAEYVFICDTFLPVSYCRRRKGTKVVQLWHSCGLMKKIAGDSPAERQLMSRRQYQNYDLFTTSAPVVSDVLSKAMDIPRELFGDTGVSRMDYYIDEERARAVRQEFEEKYPAYRGKRIILWTPTFRGTAQTGKLAGQEEILRLQRELPEDYALILKTHRFAGSQELNTPVDLPTEKLLMVADVLITDYSSIYFDFLRFRKPIVLFAPDLESYLQNPGLYVDYRTIPGRLAMTYEELLAAVTDSESWVDLRHMDEFWQEQMEYCDGHSTERLLRRLGILAE